MISKTGILKNYATFLFSDVVVFLLGLISRSIFIKSIGDYFIGITAIMNSIIGVLALSNLGLGDAFVYCLIEHFSKNNINEIQSVFSYSKKVFKIIIFVLILFSILLIPFLRFFITDIRDYNSFIIYYLFFVFSKVLTYQVGPYNAVIRADQKIRVTQIGTMLGYAISTILQIIAMLIYGSYFVYILLMLLGTLVTNIYVYIYFIKHYKWILSDSQVLSQQSKKKIFQKVKDVFITRLSSSLIDTTDNLLITRFIGTETVGFYNNYSMIVLNIRTAAKNLYFSMESAIGIHSVRSQSEAKFTLYKNILFGYHLIASIFSVGVAILMQDFIVIWLDNNHLLSNIVLYVMAADLYINIITYAQTGFINTTDIYNKTKNVYFIGALLNALLSIILVLHMGLVGIILGTLLSRMLCNFPIGLYYLCIDQFKKSTKRLLILNLIYIVQTLIIYFIVRFFLSKIAAINIITFIIKGIMTVFITLIIIFFMNVRNDAFIQYKNAFKATVKRLVRNNR